MDFILISVPNWRRYNPRSDRTPSWYRLQNDFFSDPKLWELDDASRCLLLFFFCEISKNRGKSVRLHFSYILSQRSKFSRSSLIKAIQDLSGLGVISADFGNQTVEESLPNGSTTNERTNERTLTLTPNGSARGVILHPLATLWNQTVTKLRKVKKTEDKRLKLCAQIFSSRSEKEWVTIFGVADNSSFLTGGGKTGWKASFDWVLKNANRVDEGEFDNRQGSIDGEVFVV